MNSVSQRYQLWPQMGLAFSAGTLGSLSALLPDSWQQNVYSLYQHGFNW